MQIGYRQALKFVESLAYHVTLVDFRCIYVAKSLAIATSLFLKEVSVL